LTDTLPNHRQDSEGNRIERVRQHLLEWYAASARDLPWRRTRDPYAILVSEIMLQQTQVDRVRPYFERFLDRFPTVQDLAAAPTAEVIRIWAGLGYNRRAVNLQRAAQVIMAVHGGTFPRDVEALRRLPGVGAYTAGAVAAFAFEEDVAFLDTNMRRVVARVEFGNEEHPRAEVLAAAQKLLPLGKGWVWNQALIEFGALQCTARRPACVICPLQRECAAFPVVQTDLSLRRKHRPSSSEPFETTSRYFRGRVVDALRALPDVEPDGIGLADLGPKVREGFMPDDMPWLLDLVQGLQRDGLAVIAEDSPSYDGGSTADSSSVRVRLP
jgi:A/G-specific adenine glycosylase